MLAKKLRLGTAPESSLIEFCLLCDEVVVVVVVVEAAGAGAGFTRKPVSDGGATGRLTTTLFPRTRPEVFGGGGVFGGPIVVVVGEPTVGEVDFGGGTEGGGIKTPEPCEEESIFFVAAATASA